MKALTLATAISLAAMVGTPALAEDRQATKGEVKLAKMLEGRVAGEPQSCIYAPPNYRLTVIDGTALVYRANGVLYVNRTRDPENIDDRDTMVRRVFGSGTRVCKSDIITTRNSHVGHYTGNVFLTDFVPYRRAES